MYEPAGLVPRSAEVHRIGTGGETILNTLHRQARQGVNRTARRIRDLPDAIQGADESQLGGAASDRTWAVAISHNARPATGTILAGDGLSACVIDDRITVATSVEVPVAVTLVGPAMDRMLANRIPASRGRRPRQGHRPTKSRRPGS